VLLLAIVGAGTWYTVKADRDTKMVDDLRSNLAQTTEKAEATATELEASQQALADLQAKSKAGLAALDQRIAELSANLDSLGQAKDQLAEQSAATEKRLTDELAGVNGNLDQAQQSIATLEQNKARLEAQIAEQLTAAEAQKTKAAAALAAMLERKTALVQALAEEKTGRGNDAQAHQQEMTQTLSQSHEYETALSQSAPEHAARLKELLGQVKQLTATNEEQSAILAEARETMGRLRDELKNSENELASTREAMASADTAHKAAVTELQQQMQANQEQAQQEHDALVASNTQKLDALITRAAADARAQKAAQQRLADHAAATLASTKSQAGKDLQQTRARAQAQLKAQKAVAAKQAALAVMTLATAKEHAGKGLAEAQAAAKAQLESTKMSASREHEALLSKYHTETSALREQLASTRKAAAAEAERAMVAQRSCLLNQSALAAVYNDEVKNLRGNLQSTRTNLDTQSNMIAELGQMGATFTPRGLVLTFGEADLSFAPGKTTPTPESVGSLDVVAAFLKNYPGQGVLVEGHTDSLGADALNQQLSEKRAQSVFDALVERGIDPMRIRAVGYGEAQPIASNNTRKGRSKNRRVNLAIVQVGKLPAAPAAEEAAAPAAE
jgi:outer membrane protein OmpA-like peptidoglycan-associated protein